MAEINPVEAVLNNADLLTKILTRVPPKPVFTFRIVSKHWLSLVSDPDFLVNHTRHHLITHPPLSISPFHLYYVNTSTSIRSDVDCTGSLPKLDCLEIIRQNKLLFKIFSSCNEFILGKLSNKDPYIVFNPTTKKYRLIHKPLGSHDLGRVLGTILAFDPLKSFHYKIIRFILVHYPVRMVYIDVFSSESGAWKDIHLQDLPKGFDCDTEMIFWNGAIHWMDSPDYHVRFIVDEEKFIRDRIPTSLDSFPGRGVFGYFGKTDNGLLLIKFFSEFSDEVFTVFEMDKDNCWSAKHQIDLKALLSKHPIRSFKYSVLYVKSGTKKGDFSMVLAISEKIILYEGKANGYTDTKVLYDFPYHCTFGSYHEMHPLIECLAPVL